MTDNLREFAALDALGALTSEDARRLDDATEADPDLAAQRDADRAVVLALESVVARVSPAPDLADRIVAAARADTPASERAVAPRLRNRAGRPRRQWWRATRARRLAGRRRSTIQPGQVECWSSTYRAPARPGRPPLRGVGPACRATEMEAVGSFSPTRPSVHLELPLPGSGTYGAVDVSIEEDGAWCCASGVTCEFDGRPTSRAGNHWVCISSICGRTRTPHRDV
jgi:hypothetical protein